MQRLYKDFDIYTIVFIDEISNNQININQLKNRHYIN